MLQLKTTSNHVEAVKQTIDRLHPYDVPEIVVVPIVDGSESYLRWLRDETRDL